MVYRRELLSKLPETSMTRVNLQRNTARYAGVDLAFALRNEEKHVVGSIEFGIYCYSGEHSCIQNRCEAQVDKNNTLNNKSAIFLGVVGGFFVVSSNSYIQKERRTANSAAEQAYLKQFSQDTLALVPQYHTQRTMDMEHRSTPRQASALHSLKMC